MDILTCPQGRRKELGTLLEGAALSRGRAGTAQGQGKGCLQQWERGLGPTRSWLSGTGARWGPRGEPDWPRAAALASCWGKELSSPYSLSELAQS